MKNIDIILDLKEVKETLEGGLVASNINMSDGSTVEESILNLQNELNSNKVKLIEVVNNLIDF